MASEQEGVTQAGSAPADATKTARSFAWFSTMTLLNPAVPRSLNTSAPCPLDASTGRAVHAMVFARITKGLGHRRACGRGTRSPGIEPGPALLPAYGSRHPALRFPPVARFLPREGRAPAPTPGRLHR